MSKDELSQIQGQLFGIILVVSRNTAFSCRSEKDAREVTQQISEMIEKMKLDDDPFNKGVETSLSDILSIVKDIFQPNSEQTTTASR